MKKLLLFLGMVLPYILTGQSITIDSSTPFAACGGQNITVNFTPSGGATGPFTVELIETYSRSTPYSCGNGTSVSTKASVTTSSNAATVTIPSGLTTRSVYTPTGFCSGNYYSFGNEYWSYTLKVTGSNATSASFNITLNSTCTPTLGVSFAPTSICAGKTGNVSWYSAGANVGNVFTVELSNSSGSFSSPISLGTLSGNNTDGAKSLSVVIPANTTSGSSFQIKVKSSDPVSEKTIGFSVNPLANCGPVQAIVVPTQLCSGATSTVSYTLDDSFQPGNIFSAELSNENGNFDNPITIASITSQTASTIPIILPNNLPYGGSYRIRVLASLPSSGSPYTSPSSNYFSVGIPKPQLQNSTYNFCENALFSVSAYTGSYQPESGYTFNWKKDNLDVNNLNQYNATDTYNEYYQRLNGQSSDAGVYSLTVVRNSDGCAATSSSNTNAIFNAAAPPAPTTSPVSVPSGNTVGLTAAGCTGTIYWYKTSTPSSNDYLTTGTYTTPELTQNITYYAACYNSTCFSSRTPLLVTVDASNAPSAPNLSVSDNNFCSGAVQNPKLTAMGCSGIVRWYLKYNLTDTQFYLQETDNAAPYEFSLSNSTSRYYAADCRENNILSTNKAEILVTVKPIPTSPNPSPSYQTINSGSDTRNNISGSDCVNGTVKWYDASNGGTLLYTGRTYTQANVTSSYTLFPTCTENTCESSYRYSATVNVQTSGVAAPSFFTENETICGNGTATIVALGCTQGTVNWYTYSNSVYTLVGSGQNYTTPTLTYNSNTSSYQFYADCTIGAATSSKNSKYIYLNRQPGTPASNQPTIACNTSTTLTATGCSTSSPEYFTVYWYASANASSSLSSSTSFTTPVLSATTTYYVQCSAGNCKSPRVPITVTVGCTPPDAPVISSSVTTVCSGVGVNLTATGCSSTVNWSDGGTGATRNNVMFNNSTILTATCNNGLASTNSNSVSITVNPKPSLVVSNPASVSPPNTVDITLSSVTAGSTLHSATISYHSDAAGNVSLTSPPANAINVSDTYYIKATTLESCTDIKPVIVVISDCGTAIVLQSTVNDFNTGSHLKKTNETITASNIISGNSNVTYRSNKSILLTPQTNAGFKVENGAVFKAEIGGCN